MLLTSWLRAIRTRSRFSPRPVRRANRSIRRRLVEHGRGRALAAAGLERLEPRILLAAPVAVDDTAQTAEDQPVFIDVLANDYDPDPEDTIQISSDTGTSVEGGEFNVSFNGQTDGITYEPPPGFTGTDSFTYTIADDAENEDSATVTITVGAGVNEPPHFQSDPFTLSVAEDEPVGELIGVLGCQDPDEDPLTYTILSGNAHGRFELWLRI